MKRPQKREIIRVKPGHPGWEIWRGNKLVAFATTAALAHAQASVMKDDDSRNWEDQ